MFLYKEQFGCVLALSIWRMKVAFIGADGAGKTSLILRYTKNTFSTSYLATIGCDFYEVNYEMPNNATLQTYVWDIAAQKNFERLKNQYLSFTHLSVICVDINRNTPEYIDPWIEDIKKCVPKNTHYLIALTKVDSAKSKDYVANLMDQLKSRYQVPIIETSAKDNYRVAELFTLIGTTLWKIK